jgi:hypothetical protein
MKRHTMRRLIDFRTLTHETAPPIVPDDIDAEREARLEALRRWRGLDDDDQEPEQ